MLDRAADERFTPRERLETVGAALLDAYRRRLKPVVSVFGMLSWHCTWHRDGGALGRFD